MRLSTRTDESLGRLAHDVRQELLRRRGRTHKCVVCGDEFVARAGAKTCSTTCRVRAQRARATHRRKDHHMIGIGYEGLTVETMIGRLLEKEIDVLVDVRLNAISRKAGFSKRALAAALEHAGIRYIHDPRLGNPKENRAGYAELGSDAGRQARDGFRSLLDENHAAAAVRDLSELLADHSVALLCFEADERHCHREQVIAAVRQPISHPPSSRSNRLTLLATPSGG